MYTSTAHTAKQATAARRLRIAVASAITLTAGAGLASASEISVNFEGTASALTGTGYAGPSAVQELTSTWNEVANATGSNIALTDNLAQTAATMTFSAAGTYKLTGTAYGDQNLQMLNGYVYSYPGTIAATATVSGLGSTYTGNGYSVYVYFNSQSTGEQGTVTVSGSGSQPTYNFQAETMSFTPGGGDADFVQTTITATTYPTSDYALFTGLTSTSFTISLVSTNGGSNRAGITGFQVVPAPEPCSAAMIGLGATTLLLSRRRSFAEPQVEEPKRANDFGYRCAPARRRADRILPSLEST